MEIKAEYIKWHFLTTANRWIDSRVPIFLFTFGSVKWDERLKMHLTQTKCLYGFHRNSLAADYNILSFGTTHCTGLEQHNVSRYTYIRYIYTLGANKSWVVEDVPSCVGSCCVAQPDRNGEGGKEQKRNGLKGNWVYKMHHASGTGFINMLAHTYTHTQWRIPNEWRPHWGHIEWDRQRGKKKGGAKGETERDRRKSDASFSSFLPLSSMHGIVCVSVLEVWGWMRVSTERS